MVGMPKSRKWSRETKYLYATHAMVYNPDDM
jgi:hypothetical protein